MKPTRLPSPDDFKVSVEGVGEFTFARRRMRDEIAIQVEYARIIDGAQPTEWLMLVGGWMSALKVLTVHGPEGWDLDELDPTEKATYEKMNRIYTALIEKEHSFRRGPQQASQAGGA